MSLSRDGYGEQGGGGTSITISSWTAGGPSVGDLMIVGFDSQHPLSPNSGWTQLWADTLTVNSATIYGLVVSKVLTSGDISSLVPASGSTSGAIGALYVAMAGIEPHIDTSAAAVQSSGASLSAGPITPNTGTDWLWQYNLSRAGSLVTVGGTASLSLLAYEGELGDGSMYDSNGTVSQVASTQSATSTYSSPEMDAVVIIAIADTSAPSAPTLTEPTNSSYTNVSSGVTLGGYYNSTDAENQNAYALRIKTSVGSYNYYNAGSNTLQSTIVWNTLGSPTAPGGFWSVTLGSALVSDGNTYNWSLASQEAGSSTQGPFATDFTFIAQTPPSVTVTAPTGTITYSQPTVTWTDTLPGGASQTNYEVIICTATGSGAPGGTTLYSSGVVASASTSQLSSSLSNGTWYAYVQVTETGGQTSSWAYSAFTINFNDPPAMPTYTVNQGVDGNGVPCLIHTIQGHDNILDSATSTILSGNIGTWVAGSNTAVAESGTQDEDAPYSLKMTPSASGTITAHTSATAYAVVPSSAYTITASFRAGTTARSCTVEVSWYTSGNTLISSNTSGGTNDSTSAWTAVSENVTSPSTAAFAEVIVTVASVSGSSDVHYVDEIGIMPGTGAAWTLGGYAGTEIVSILRSDGLYVRNAGYTTSVPGGPDYITVASGGNCTALSAPSQSLTLYDYESVPSVAYTFTAEIQGGGGAYASATYGPITFTETSWWIIDPVTPANSVLAIVTSQTTSGYKLTGANYPLSDSPLPQLPSVTNLGSFGESGTLVVQTQTPTEYSSLVSLVSYSSVKFIINPFSQGFYSSLAISDPTGGTSGASHATTYKGGTATTPYRESTLSYTEVGRP